MIHVDGRTGEGGGQVLRTSLSLSAALGEPVRVEHVRAGRTRPGLMRQHLTALLAVREVCDGEVAGAELGSQRVELRPGRVRAGEYRFSVGTAGSANLVLQTVLPPLLCADGPSEVVVEGGTHNPWAPPFEALERAFAPLVRTAGAGLELTLERHGFYPAGGGRLRARIVPPDTARPLRLVDRGALLERDVEVLVAHVPEVVARKELHVLERRLPWRPDEARVVPCPASPGPGNVVNVTLAFEDVTEVFSGFGRKGLRAERVGVRLARDVRDYVATDAPIGEHLADQLMLPLCVLAGGEFRATRLTRHAVTNAEVLSTFLPEAVTLTETGATAEVRVRASGLTRPRRPATR